MSKINSLEEFLREYLAKPREKSGALSFDDYRHKEGMNYARTYSRGVENAYATLRRSSPYHADNAESLYKKGLFGSGYAEHLGKQAKGTYEGTLKSLYEEKTNKEREALGKYSSYLSNYAKSRESLIKSGRGELLKNNIVSLDTAYDYAISAGLSSDEALNVTRAVYEVSREKIMANVIERAAALEISADAAALLGEKMGLTREDCELVRREVEKYLGKDEEFTVPDGYLDELEAEADRLTTNTKKKKKGND